MIPHLPTNRLTRHLLFWVGAILLAGSTYILENFDSHGYFSHRVGVLADLLLARLPTFMVYTYLLTYWILPLVFRRKYVPFLTGVLLLNMVRWLLNDILTYSLKIPLGEWLHEELPLQQDAWLFGSRFPGRTFWISNVIAGLFICIRLFLEWQQKQAESQRLEREKLQTELHLLKLQLNPDFLFSALDTLQPMIRQQAKQAPEVVLKLAHLLRYILYESHPDRVPLAREIDLIDNYIFLQQSMHSKDLEVSFTVRGNIIQHSIAPLSLFPIVEKAFAQLPDHQSGEPGWISIDLAVSESQISLKVVSECTNEFANEDKALVDLPGLEKQLTFYYPGQHHLKIWQEDRIKVVTLNIGFETIITESEKPFRVSL